MADENAIMQAKAAYDTLCEFLNEIEWEYDTDEDNFRIISGAQGDDLQIGINISVDPEKRIITLLSKLPVVVPEDIRVKMAMAVCLVNYEIIDGSFDYNIDDGIIIFRMTTSFIDSLIGKELFDYLIFTSCETIDKYNDRFLMMANGEIDLKGLASFIKGE